MLFYKCNNNRNGLKPHSRGLDLNMNFSKDGSRVCFGKQAKARLQLLVLLSEPSSVVHGSPLFSVHDSCSERVYSWECSWKQQMLSIIECLEKVNADSQSQVFTLAT